MSVLKDPGEAAFVEVLFQEGAIASYVIAREISKGLDYQYPFMSEAKWVILPVAQQMTVYWHELIGRAHLASLSTFIRGLHWLDSARFCLERGQRLAFASSIRNFIESMADSLYSLDPVPVAFARYFARISVCVQGKAKAMEINKDLENLLLHYVFAQRTEKGSGLPPSHRTRSTNEYLGKLEPEIPNIGVLYGELCDQTHPGYRSVALDLRQIDTPVGVMLKFQTDPAEAREGLLKWCRDNSHDISTAMQLGFNAAIIVLKVVNLFRIPYLRTPLVDSLSPQIERWQHVLKELRASRPLPL